MTSTILSSIQKVNSIKKKKFKSLEEFENTKWVIKTEKTKDRQHKGQNKKEKKRYTRQTHKTKDRVTGNPL
jgi:hypothetical protein